MKIIISLLIFSIIVIGMPDIKGVPPEDALLYSSSTFKCKSDSSTVIDINQVNDDYCDCQDGSDEIYTSACPNGRFYCSNIGYRPEFIPSSRVNDGVCDCCDGSDEYSNLIKCVNNCVELGADNLREIREKIDRQLRGIEAKNRIIEFAKEHKEAKQSELVKLNEEIKELQDECDKKKTISQEFEEKYNTLSNLREAEEKNKQEELEKIKNDTNSNDLIEKVNISPSEEENEAMLAKNEATNILLTCERNRDEKIKQRDENIKIMNSDFGPENEFFELYGQCFNLEEKKYTYEVCPYQKANQKEGHSTTSLGTWGQWENGHEIMKFENGQSCWQGPKRSLSLHFICDVSHNVISIEEPSKCVYSAIMGTPSVCSQNELETLRKKLKELQSPPVEIEHEEL